MHDLHSQCTVTICSQTKEAIAHLEWQHLQTVLKRPLLKRHTKCSIEVDRERKNITPEALFSKMHKIH